MPNFQISSLHSPHVERVKALLHNRGKKIRRESGEFVVDSFQGILSAIKNNDPIFPIIKSLYATPVGLEKIETTGIIIPNTFEIIEVTPEIISAMSDVEASQGALAVCSHEGLSLERLLDNGGNISYFWQLQDPGNAGSIIRSSDAAGFSSALFSPESVDLYSPKVIRSTVGSLWHIPVLANVEIDVLVTMAFEKGYQIFALDAKASLDIRELPKSEKLLLIFGNEARGLPKLPSGVKQVAIPMKGHTESFNVASAATIAMYEVGLRNA
jgi:RNA methyltransferase, TrmH family